MSRIFGVLRECMVPYKAFHVFPGDMSMLSEYESLGPVARGAVLSYTTELLLALLPAPKS